MYIPTQKQKDAIFNMTQAICGTGEDFLPYFEDKEEFQKYFQEIQEQLSQKIRRDKKRCNFQKLSYETKQQIYKKSEEKKLKYYQKEENLLTVGYKYYHKYKPSKKKYKEYLYSKCKNQELTEKILSESEYFINDEEVLLKKIRTLKDSGKTSYYIISSLASKGFKHQEIQDLLKEYFEFDEVPRSLEQKIKRKIIYYRKKGKRDNEIKYLLFPLLFDYNNKESLISNYLEQCE